MHKIRLAIFFSLLLAPIAWSSDIRLKDHKQGIWSISAGADESRWIVIHDIVKGASTGIYHVEVLARKNGAPAWQVRHLANHIAITEAALLRSVVKPLSKGAVYPESFETSYKDWQSQNNGAGGGVCQSEVVQCLSP